jgi:hypothetical protein
VEKYGAARQATNYNMDFACWTGTGEAADTLGVRNRPVCNVNLLPDRILCLQSTSVSRR